MIALIPLANLNSDISKRAAVNVGARRFNKIFIVDLGDSESVPLAAPGTVPVDLADLGVSHPKLKAALSTRRRVRSATRGNSNRVSRGDRNVLDGVTRDFFILVVVLVKLAPEIYEYHKRDIGNGSYVSRWTFQSVTGVEPTLPWILRRM